MLLARDAERPDPAAAPANPREKLLSELAAHQRVRAYRARQIVLHQSDRTDHIVIILDGWAEQYVQLADGRRQIVGIAMAGDLCSTDLDTRAALDCSIAALTPLNVAIIGKPEFRALLAGHPPMARSFWNSQLRSLAIQRRWTTVLGRLDALERVAHLLCEVYMRQRLLGLADPCGCAFPLTQTQIADACGLTQVHTNRTIQELRRRRLVDLRSKRLVVRDFETLAKLARFDSSYLGQGSRGSPFTASPETRPV